MNEKLNIQREAEIGLKCLRCKSKACIKVVRLQGKQVGRCASCKWVSKPDELQQMQRKAVGECPAAFCANEMESNVTTDGRPEGSNTLAGKDTAHMEGGNETNVQGKPTEVEPVAVDVAGHHAMLITKDEWTSLLRQVEILRKDSDEKTRKLQQLETSIATLTAENKELKSKLMTTRPQVGRPVLKASVLSNQPAIQQQAPMNVDSAGRVQVSAETVPDTEQRTEANPRTDANPRTETNPKTAETSYASAARKAFSPDVLKRLIEARTALIQAKFIRQRKLNVRAFYFRNVQRGKISELRRVIATAFPWECRLKISFIGGSLVEILADTKTAADVDLVGRAAILRWKYVADYDPFSDSLKKTKNSLPDELRTLRNLEMVRHRMALCEKYAQHEDALQWYKQQKEEAERRIEAIPKQTTPAMGEDGDLAMQACEQTNAEPLTEANKRQPDQDSDGFTFVTRKTKQKLPERLSSIAK